MGNDGSSTVAATRRIDAPVGDIFELLAHPGRHPDIDGCGMLREAASDAVVSGVGDVFVMKMHNPALGDYEMNNHVVEYELNRRIGWEPALRDGSLAADSSVPIGTRVGHRWIFELASDGPDATVVTEIYDCSGAPERIRLAVHNSNGWVERMTKTLERLDELCAKKLKREGT
jgi:hypothetical protein